MPNIGTALKEEIVRLDRKGCRQQIEPLKKTTTTQMRREICLTRVVAQLKRHLAIL